MSPMISIVCILKSNLKWSKSLHFELNMYAHVYASSQACFATDNFWFQPFVKYVLQQSPLSPESSWSSVSPSPIALCSRLILRLVTVAYTQRLFPQRCCEKLRQLWRQLRQSWWTEVPREDMGKILGPWPARGGVGFWLVIGEKHGKNPLK